MKWDDMLSELLFVLGDAYEDDCMDYPGTPEHWSRFLGILNINEHDGIPLFLGNRLSGLEPLALSELCGAGEFGTVECEWECLQMRLGKTFKNISH